MRSNSLVVFWAFVMALPASSGNVNWQDRIRVSEDLRGQGRLVEAREILEHAATGDPEIPRDVLARIYTDLGSVAQDQGKYMDADRYYRRSMALWSPDGAVSQLGLAPRNGSSAQPAFIWSLWDSIILRSRWFFRTSARCA